MITTVTGKHQSTIPAALVNQLDIQPGTQLEWAVGGEGMLIVRVLPARGALARRISGMGKKWLAPGVDPIAALVEERAQDDETESAA